MTSTDERGLPLNIQQKSVNSHRILFDATHFSTPLPEIFSGQYWQSQNAITGQALGRGTTYFFKHNQQEYVLRHYRRGGLIGKVLNDQYLYMGIEQSRAWREFKLLQHMQSLGLNSPIPIAAKVKKTGLYYQADIITVKIPDAQDLSQYLLSKPLTTNLWEKVGETIASFHNAHIYHHDLNIHNIMIDTNHKVWLIDFDKCEIRKGQSWKTSNISRLKRSFEKEQNLGNIHWKKTDWNALISAYSEALISDPSR